MNRPTRILAIVPSRVSAARTAEQIMEEFKIAFNGPGSYATLVERERYIVIAPSAPSTQPWKQRLPAGTTYDVLVFPESGPVLDAINSLSHVVERDELPPPDGRNEASEMRGTTEPAPPPTPEEEVKEIEKFLIQQGFAWKEGSPLWCAVVEFSSKLLTELRVAKRTIFGHARELAALRMDFASMKNDRDFWRDVAQRLKFIQRGLDKMPEGMGEQLGRSTIKEAVSGDEQQMLRKAE